MPSIMVAVLFFAVMVAIGIKNPEPKVSARAGLGAGFIIFVIYVMSQLATIQEFNLNKFSNLSPFNLLTWIIFGIGTCVGFGLLRAIAMWIQKRLIGLITLVLSAASLSTLFSYFFVPNGKDVVTPFALGSVLGVFLYMLFFPNGIIRLLQKPVLQLPGDEDDWYFWLGMIGFYVAVAVFGTILIYLIVVIIKASFHLS